MLLGAALLATREQSPRKSRLVGLLVVLGGVFVASSATPLPWWFYAAWAVVALGWFVFALFGKSSRGRKIRSLLVGSFSFLTLAAAGWELSYRFPTRLPDRTFSSLTVVGDSISAGMFGPDEPTWPKQLRDKYGVRVNDVSRAGATARSALRQAENIDDVETLILVEIGGNDFFGQTTAKQFAVDLEELLRTLSQPERLVVMLELPLPPFYNEYGRVQRELASRYDVALIPKRRFLRVLAAKGATIDSVHLTERGHSLMGEMVWKHLGDSLQTSNSNGSAQ